MNDVVGGVIGALSGALVGGALVVASRRLARGEDLEPGSEIAAKVGPPVVCAVVFAALTIAYLSDPLGLVLRLVFGAVLVQVVFFDLEHGLILDRVIIPAAALALAFSLFQQPWWAGIATGLVIGGLFLGLGLVGSWLAGTEALGLGDVKLAACIGLFLGPLPSLGAMVVAFATAGAAAVGIALWRRSLAGRIALGPYLAVGALIAMYPWR